MERQRRGVVLAVILTLLSVTGPAAEALPRPADGCGLLDVVAVVNGTTLCTHGGDVAHGAPPSTGGRGAPLPVDAPQCYSDGDDGYRVAVLYVHANGTPNDLATHAATLRRDLGQVEGMIARSAAPGTRRHVRWETEAAPTGGCQVRLQAVALPAGELADFARTVAALAQRGFDRADRRYVVFADRSDYCGIATVARDDRRGAGNAVHHQSGYARVDRPCWARGDDGSYATTAHELLHTLGAVQESAPHSTPIGHCTDGWDPMCYADSPDTRVEIRCQDDDPATHGEQDHHHRRLDCGGDDYFATNPAPGSYLATHWNTADAAYFASRPGRGPGHRDGARSPAADPRQRTRAWPAGRGAFRPLLADGAGWEACRLPITLRTAGTTTTSTSGGIIGIGGSSQTTTTGDPALERAAGAVVATVNDLADTTVLKHGDPTSAAPADGEIVLSAGAAPSVEVWTAQGRIVRAAAEVPSAALGDSPAGRREVARAVLQALGLGRVSGDDAYLGRLGGGSDTSTRLALRHLYTDACERDARLDVRAGGHLLQTQATGSRTTLDLAPDVGDPIELALAVSRHLRATAGDRWGRAAVVCRADDPADCLAGSGLLGVGGPLVLVPGGAAGRLPDAVADELRAALALGADVYVLGGPAAVSPEIEAALRDELPSRTVRRLFGPDRYQTATTIARTVATGRGGTVLLARGDDPADAVAVAAYAARAGLPVVLTTPNHLVDATATYLHQTRPEELVLLGGHKALAPDVEQIAGQVATTVRVAGATRTSTAVAVARSAALWDRSRVGGAAAVVGVAGFSPATWQLALAAAPLAARLDAPVLYLRPDGIPGGVGGVIDTAEYLAALAVDPSTSLQATSVVVGARLGGLAPRTAAAFHAEFLPAFSEGVTTHAG